MKRSKALKTLSKIISPTYNKNSDLESIVSSLDRDWEEVISVANRYQLIPNLYANLKRKELLDLIEDEQLLGYIKEIYNMNSFRNINILKQVNEICELLYNELAINVILLKGVSALSEKHYENIGERVMLDIDLLVPQEKIFEAIDVLKNNGYSEIPSKELKIGWHHYHRLYHPDKMTSLELHRYPLSENILLAKKEYLIESKSIPNSYIFNPTYEIIHSFLHTQVSHNYHKKYFISLRHLHHFSTMVTFYDKKIDYTIIDNFMKKNSLDRVWNEYFYMISELFLINNRGLLLDKKNGQKYTKKVYNYLDNSNSIKSKLSAIQYQINYIFSYKNLNGQYGIKNRLQRYLYIPIYLLYGIKKFLLNKESRDEFLGQMRSSHI